MLVLSRKSTEEILIGDEIIVTVLEVRGNRVKIGIMAPPEVTISRSASTTITPVRQTDTADIVVSDPCEVKDASSAISH
ncbi:carbon storage regulator [Bremerella cremea]|uniref:carbon storage regulator n=1 Tax=Bremerella cremea TaxID=1031537 RepID=UPI0031EFBDF0